MDIVSGYVKDKTVPSSWEHKKDPNLVAIDEPSVSQKKVVKASEVKHSLTYDVSKKDIVIQDLVQRFGEGSLDNVDILKSESELLAYSELISSKLLRYQNNDYYVDLLKWVMRFSLKSMKASDVKQVASSIDEVFNLKLKAQREADNKTKSKTKALKKKFFMEIPEDHLGVDDYDDYDFGNVDDEDEEYENM